MYKAPGAIESVTRDYSPLAVMYLNYFIHLCKQTVSPLCIILKRKHSL